MLEKVGILSRGGGGVGDEASKLALSPFCPVGVGGTIFQNHMQALFFRTQGDVQRAFLFPAHSSAKKERVGTMLGQTLHAFHQQQHTHMHAYMRTQKCNPFIGREYHTLLYYKV